MSEKHSKFNSWRVRVPVSSSFSLPYISDMSSELLIRFFGGTVCHWRDATRTLRHKYPRDCLETTRSFCSNLPPGFNECFMASVHSPFFFAALVCTEVASFLPWPLKYSSARVNGLLVGITSFFSTLTPKISV
jgi:hypothetical protein